jgi:hypothetical protein
LLKGRADNMLRTSLSFALLASLPISLTACATSDADVEVLDQTLKSVENGFTYLSIRSDGDSYLVRAVNGGRLLCADGYRRPECKVASLDLEALALPDDDQLALTDKLGERRAVIVGGTLGRRTVRTARGPVRVGHLEVGEAWVAGSVSGAAALAKAEETRHGGFAAEKPTAVLVNLNGVRCIQAPCPDKSEETLNGGAVENIADLDFRPSGATEDEIAAAWNALTAEGLPGLIVVGHRYTVRGRTGATAAGRTVFQFYTRVVATEPALLSGEECELAGGFVRGDIGDGNVACASGENEIGRVRTGIEGGVCCERIVLTPDQCESAGGFIRTDIGDGKIACEAGEIDLGRVAFGREGGVCCQ